MHCRISPGIWQCETGGRPTIACTEPRSRAFRRQDIDIGHWSVDRMNESGKHEGISLEEDNWESQLTGDLPNQLAGCLVLHLHRPGLPAQGRQAIRRFLSEFGHEQLTWGAARYARGEQQPTRENLSLDRVRRRLHADVGRSQSAPQDPVPGG